MKKFILFAAAAAMFAACANENDLALTQQQAANETDANLISFDAYTMRSTNTRAGVPGAVTLDGLKNTAGLKDAGFGVFAYYTDNFDYTPLYVPNFMYNEQVKWQSGEFKYDLPKYWPNEHGSAAKSSDQDRVSFFAYLPYVETDASTGMVDGVDASDPTHQWGIMGMKRNSVQGDPFIQYITSFDVAHSVDLCWGTTKEEVKWATNGSTQTIAAGKPWLNVRKPDGGIDVAKVNFNFQHATSNLKVTVQTDFTGGWEILNPTSSTQTRVWIRSIRFTGIAKKAALNLNNPKPNTARWMDYYGTNELEMGESVTIYDGRKDGSEGVAGAESVNESVLGLNPDLIQKEGLITSNAWTISGTVLGVKDDAVNLFCEGSSAAAVDKGIFVIPTGEKVDVEIVYDIETIDEKLPVYLSDGETHGSTVENRILKQNVFAKLENGKTYTLNLILGMKDVKFNATVEDDWTAGGTQDVYLPQNMPSFAAGSPASVTVPYNAESVPTFTITGLEATKTASISGFTPDSWFTVAPDVTSEVPANGCVTVSGGTIIPNTTVGSHDISFTVDDNGTVTPATTVTITQAAKPFVFNDIALNTSTTAFDIQAGDGSGSVTTAQYTAGTKKIYKKNGGNWDEITTWTLTPTDGTPDKIAVTDVTGLAVDDIIKITIQVGDAPEVSKEITVTAP